YISTVSDEKNRRTVLDFFKDKVSERLYPVGRLDYDTSGVLLLTNDGDFANKMMHPSGEIDKVYLARVKGIVTQESLKPLTKGIVIDGYKTKPATANLVSVDKKNESSLVQLVIHEGRYHQVKKMFDAIGFPVKKLRRDQFGCIDVAGLAAGEYRPLTPHEIKTLISMANDKKEKPKLRFTKMRQF
ncbi:MAG: rRNA pseudouridine synthase, partial [Turicibacter sp.]|nr:rRNA pseudouridine synthase [Turicibacter sp.]